MDDTFHTIKAIAEGHLTEKKSRFLAFAVPVRDVEEVKTVLDEYRKKYYDARHVCWAYMLGWERADFRANDDGEPSGTAGKPILRQINSYQLTDVLILVVRYFGGTLLGTGGLIRAYREAAKAAIDNACIVQKTVDDRFTLHFDYLLLNDVMRVLKQFPEADWEQDFAERCVIRLRVRRSLSLPLYDAFAAVYGVEIEKIDGD
ncbi:MAG TPA: YigZ family protein [Porphyromonadaceae bacterium]|nr:YigZ family protein [Porphyromonadaceae bacterium]